jgi:hypothetical protein
MQEARHFCHFLQDGKKDKMRMVGRTTVIIIQGRLSGSALYRGKIFSGVSLNHRFAAPNEVVLIGLLIYDFIVLVLPIVQRLQLKKCMK